MDQPYIVLCDDDNLADRLISALRDAHGTQVQVFVRDHHETGETVLVLLPENGPSLAAALRDWVDGWWSDPDAAKFGSPENYLRGMDVVVEPGDYTTFTTSCPFCGVNDQLSVVGGTFQAMGISIAHDGFAFADAQMMQTEDEEVRCDACGSTFSMDAIRL